MFIQLVSRGIPFSYFVCTYTQPRAYSLLSAPFPKNQKITSSYRIYFWVKLAEYLKNKVHIMLLINPVERVQFELGIRTPR